MRKERDAPQGPEHAVNMQHGSRPCRCVGTWGKRAKTGTGNRAQTLLVVIDTSPRQYVSRHTRRCCEAEYVPVDPESQNNHTTVTPVITATLVRNFAAYGSSRKTLYDVTYTTWKVSRVEARLRPKAFIPSCAINYSPALGFFFFFLNRFTVFITSAATTSLRRKNNNNSTIPNARISS